MDDEFKDDRRTLTLDDLEGLRAQADAYPFVCDGWAYTRDHDLKSIRYGDPRRAHWPVRSNIRFALSHLAPWRLRDWEKTLYSGLMEGKGPIRRYLAHVRIAATWLRHTQDNLPDGVIDRGGIITFWEEAGQHVAAFNPAVTQDLVRLAIVGYHAENGTGLRKAGAPQV